MLPFTISFVSKDTKVSVIFCWDGENSALLCTSRFSSSDGLLRLIKLLRIAKEKFDETIASQKIKMMPSYQGV